MRRSKAFLAIILATCLSGLIACGGGGQGGSQERSVSLVDNGLKVGAIPIVDTVPPVVTLQGESAITLMAGDVYLEAGAAALDDRDGLLEVSISGVVDTTKEGAYVVVYTAADKSGNEAKVERKVRVILPADTTPPVITLKGDPVVTVTLGQDYLEDGAAAVDDRDGALSVQVSGEVDTSSVGQYVVTYLASDTAGNASSAERQVAVVLPPDTVPPVITLNGKEVVLVMKNGDFHDDGANAVDDRDGAVEIMVEGEVDISSPGDYEITYIARDSYDNISKATRHVRVSTSSRPFITTWDIRTVKAVTSLSLGAFTRFPVDYEIDWGDGQTDVGVVGPVVHLYEEQGEYQVKISGEFPGFVTHNPNKKMLMSIDQWGDIEWKTMYRAFSGCRNMVGAYKDMPNVSYVVDMEGMFSFASKFNSSVSGWDVSSVENMARAFWGAKSFNQDMSTWDTSAVESMKGMFWDAESFNGDVSSWDVSNVAIMDAMFKGATAFSQEIGDWDVSSVTSMESMFEGAKVFNQEIGSWDVSSVTSMDSMFYLAEIFDAAISEWDVSSVTNMASMFQGASIFNQAIDRWDVSSVESMELMFLGAKIFNQNIGAWDVSSVVNMAEMFSATDAFNQYIGDWDVSSVESMRGMFSHALLFNQDVGRWDVSAVKDMDAMFLRNPEFNQNISHWDVSSVESMWAMFNAAVSFNQDIGGWNVESVVDMNGMFLSAQSFNQDISNWNVSSVESMDQMLVDTSFSTGNYDELLAKWSKLPLHQNVEFGAGLVKYSSSVEPARDVLVKQFGWRVEDGGLVVH